jgi:hypothetical protein
MKNLIYTKADNIFDENFQKNLQVYRYFYIYFFRLLTIDKRFNFGKIS